MKTIKRLLVLAILLLNINVFAQWQQGEYVDDFGDKTGETYQYFITNEGSFSNSATDNSKIKAQFVLSEKSLSIYVYEYGSRLANAIDSTFENIRIKKPSGEIVTIKRVFFTKGGILYFSKNNFEDIMLHLESKGDYTMVFKRSGDYSESDYKIKFKI